MPSTSKSSRRRAKKLKSVRKAKKRLQVKQQTKNWLDIPSDVMANIIQRIGAFDTLNNAKYACSTWRRICNDPAMWRVIHMGNYIDTVRKDIWQNTCKNAVDRSQGQLVDFTMARYFDDKLLEYIADRSCQLRRLKISYSYNLHYESLTESLKKFTLLEELNLHKAYVSKEAIEIAGKYCPLLKVLQLNEMCSKFLHIGSGDEIAIAIGKNLRELRHLELIGNHMTNIGLLAILNGCCHLESLDLRQCLYINLKGDIWKRCCEQIRYLKLPNDSLDSDQSSNAIYGSGFLSFLQNLSL